MVGAVSPMVRDDAGITLGYRVEVALPSVNEHMLTTQSARRPSSEALINRSIPLQSTAMVVSSRSKYVSRE